MNAPRKFRDLFGGLNWRPVGWGPSWDDLAIPPINERGELSKVDLRRRAFAVLRQCWVTPGLVWRLCDRFLPGADLDPFWNPYSVVPHGAKFRGLGGSGSGDDGFRIENWTGESARANGPWQCPAKWMSIAAEFGKTRACATVSKLDSAAWCHDYQWAADLVILPRRRFSYISPWPDVIPSGSPPGGSVISLWMPGGLLRIPDALGGWHDTPGLRTRIRRTIEFEFEGERFLAVPGRGVR